MGRTLSNTMVNLGIQSACDEALYQVSNTGDVTPPHPISPPKKKCSELKDCQVKKFNYSLTSTFFLSSCVILFCL